MRDPRPEVQPLGCAKSRSVARLGLRPPSASWTEWSGNPIDAMAPWEDHRESKRRTVDRFPVLSLSELAPDPVPWWRWWLR